MSPRKNKIFMVASWLSIFFITFVSSLFIFWLIYPYQVTHIEEPITILNKNKEIRIGEPIQQLLKIHKPNNESPINPTRVLICEDGNLVTLSALPNTLNLPVGAYTFENDRYILPPKVSPGAKCVFVWRQEYRVNPIRKIPVEWRSETFTVLATKTK